MRFKQFIDLSKFLKILSLKLFGNSCNWYIQCLYVIFADRFTCGESKIWLNIKRPQNIAKMLSANFLFVFMSLLTAAIVKK